MAETYQKRGLHLFAPDDPTLGYVTRKYTEAASQTFPAGSPVKASSGHVAVFVSPSDGDMIGFAIGAGHNSAAGTDEADVILALPDIAIHATFLASAAADNVLAQADRFSPFDLASNANLLGTGEAGWYLQDSTSSSSLTIESFKHEPDFFPTINKSAAEAGDTNARVTCRVIPGASVWF